MAALDPRPLRVTVSGSFRRHLTAVQEAVGALNDEGAVVLSPADPRIVDAFGSFVFVSSDQRRSIKGVQARHLDAIQHSDFLWLVCPDGYVGPSAALEVGFAISSGTPIFSDVAPNDWTLRQFVTPLGNVRAACAFIRGIGESEPSRPSLLLDPGQALEQVWRELAQVERSLSDRRPVAGDPTEEPIRRIRELLETPGGR
ncbi:MAG: hypothetical protein ACLQBX_16100 [Candidatus Limnocylindrales bacterium]